MNDMKSKLKGMTLLSLLSLGRCVSMEKAPAPTLTLAELRNEISLSEQRLQTSMEQQQKRYVQQQHLLVQLNTDVTNMKESVKKSRQQAGYPASRAAQGHAHSHREVPGAEPGHTVDGKLLVGEAEWIWVDAANDAFQARVDTGATTSSISAQEITIFERNGKNWVRFFLSHQEMDDKIQIEAPWCVTCGSVRLPPTISTVAPWSASPCASAT